VRSGPGAARTILLFHTISARPSKQARMVGSTLGVYSLGLIFVSARTNKRHVLMRRSFGNPTVSRMMIILFLNKHRYLGVLAVSARLKAAGEKIC
jgi:hypothetical protein